MGQIMVVASMGGEGEDLEPPFDYQILILYHPRILLLNFVQNNGGERKNVRAFYYKNMGKILKSKTSWPRTVVKKWLNLRSDAHEFHSDYPVKGMMGPRRKSCTSIKFK